MADYPSAAAAEKHIAIKRAAEREQYDNEQPWTDTPDSPIDQASRRLDGALSQTGELVFLILQRLEPVLRPEQTEAALRDAADKRLASPHCNRLHRQADDVEEIAARLDRLLNRIEL